MFRGDITRKRDGYNISLCNIKWVMRVLREYILNCLDREFSISWNPSHLHPPPPQAGNFNKFKGKGGFLGFWGRGIRPQSDRLKLVEYWSFYSIDQYYKTLSICGSQFLPSHLPPTVAFSLGRGIPPWLRNPELHDVKLRWVYTHTHHPLFHGSGTLM